MSQISSLPLGKENKGNKNKRGEDQRFLTRWDFFYFRLALPIYQSALLNTAALDPSYPSEGSRAFFSYSQSEIKLFFKVPTTSSFPFVPIPRRVYLAIKVFFFRACSEREGTENPEQWCRNRRRRRHAFFFQDRGMETATFPAD